MRKGRPRRRRDVRVGGRFGKWTVLGKPEWDQNGVAYAECRCECGTVRKAAVRSLGKNQSRSCGCYRRTVLRQLNRTHGESKTPLYRVWASMLDRCRNPNATSFHNYGGRRIRVCPGVGLSVFGVGPWQPAIVEA